MQQGIDTVWRPIPDSSQAIALDTRCHHTLFTGARGPGKTDTQLMRFRRRVGKGYGMFWRGIIFDREYKNLADIILKSKRWFNLVDDGAKFLESTASLKWVWPTGEELLFRVADKADDYWNYHGHEYPYIGWNELTKWPSSAIYDAMMSTNRSSFRPQDYPKYIDETAYRENDEWIEVPKTHNRAFEVYLPEIPLEVFSTCNPYGVGHGWVKRRFIDPVPYGTVLKKSIKVISPQTKEEEIVTKTQVAIFGSYVENIYLSAQYIATLTENADENQKKAWLEGDWNIVAGGAFDDVWKPHTHVLPRFVVPRSWSVDRAFDWGSSHPFSVGWFAEANGEEAQIIHDGEVFKFCPPPGTLIQIAEWYGCEVDKITGELNIGANKGLKLSSTAIAEGIVKREDSLRDNGWIKGTVWAGPADNQIRDVREADVETIEVKMQKAGVTWEASDKSPGSRRNGMELMRDRLQAATRGEGPALYFMDNCRASIAIIPTLPRDPDKLDDVDTDAEDHCYDMARYRVLKSSNNAVKKLSIKMPT